MIRTVASVAWLAWIGVYKLAFSVYYLGIFGVFYAISRVLEDEDSRLSLRRDTPNLLKEAWSVSCSSWARTAYRHVFDDDPWLIHRYEQEGRVRSCHACGSSTTHHHRGPA